ncbi:MAG TPA: cation-transporting P-type ATPase, partial [Tepidisphaeraceae bacterium]|nr:cation-transporting P-type ATPase [Tepidisphaeraceae bacterium]
MLETETLIGEQSARAAHARTAAEVAEELNTDLVRGLSNQQVSQLAAQFGPNQLREGPPPSVLKRLAAQFQELVIWLLIAAAIVSGAMGEWTDTIVIVAIVILNGLLGFFQERRADRAMTALQKLSSPRARVIRAGQVADVPASQLVPGDMVELEAGDFVPDDLRLIHSASLQIEEAALTG